MPVHEEVIEGVNTDSPTVPQGTQAGEPGTQPVNTEVTPLSGERPVENLKGEMDRKFSRLEQMIAELAFANKQPQQVQSTPQNDDELAKLAAMGDPQAHVELTNRMTQRAIMADRVAQAITTQLRSLYSRYPQLNDPSSPLTQAALRAKAALRGLGQWPSEQALDLESIKTAIVDNPELITVAPRPGQQTVQTVPAATVTGTTVRRVAPTVQEQPITQREVDLAKRMGAKDPIAFIKKAREGFAKRQEAGRSGVDPAVAIIVKEQEGA